MFSMLPAMTSLIADISTTDSAVPDMPSQENFFDAINPFPTSTSIRTSAECGVCRWGTWVIRETIGS